MSIPEPTPLAVSVILPVYEEEQTLPPLITDIIETLTQHKIGFEIVAVDDGSQDGSFEVLRALQKTHPGLIRIAQHIYNKGNGSALRTGIRVARGEVVVCMDADGQHSAQEMPQMLSMIPPYDMVVGYRTAAYQGAWYRNLANRLYNFIASWLTNFKVLDLTSGYRAMRRVAVTHFLPLYPAGFSSPLTTTMAFLKAGYNVAYIPVDVRQRKGGKSKIRLFADGSRFFILILRMLMLYDPLRIFLPLSFALVGLGVLAFIAGVWAAQRLTFPNAALFLFITALITFLLGLVSSQIVNFRIQYHGDESVTLYEDD